MKRGGLFHSGLLLGLIGLLLLSGCLKKQVRPSEEKLKKDASLEELLSLYQLRRQEWSGFKGLAEITAESRRQGRHTVQASWTARKDSTEIRGFNLLGGTLFDLRVTDPLITLQIPSERRKIEATRDAFKEEIGAAIPIGSLDLIDWVSEGAVPKGVPPLFPALEKGEDFFILSLLRVLPEKAVLVEKIWIERTAFQVTRVAIFDFTGAPRAELTFGDYRKVGGRELPFEVQAEGHGEKVLLHFKELRPLSPSS
ncbi:MAG: hypothetical protein HY282_00835 [Nitrospirae bacterium]|nr:hypothetical protein [Candidatus Manganitrophaceae bacterium]